MPLFDVKTTDLRDYTTTKKDIEKGITKMPLIYSRVYKLDYKDDALNNRRSDEESV